jgi:hypothetical protein
VACARQIRRNRAVARQRRAIEPHAFDTHVIMEPFELAKARRGTGRMQMDGGRASRDFFMSPRPVRPISSAFRLQSRFFIARLVGRRGRHCAADRVGAASFVEERDHPGAPALLTGVVDWYNQQVEDAAEAFPPMLTAALRKIIAA